MKVLIIGFGISGKAAFTYLQDQGHEVVAVDKRRIDHPNVFLEEELSHFDFDLVVASPGIAPTHPLIKKAIALDIKLIGEMQLALDQLSSSQKIIGITGTNGKTTTTALIAHIFNESGMKARACGNIGNPILNEINTIKKEEILVVELSSFQLERLHTHTLDAAILLNIAEDHLDRYPTFKDYKRAKLHIASLRKKGAKLWSTPQIIDMLPHTENMTSIRGGNEAFAMALCKDFGLKEEEIAQAITTFKKPKHRLQYIDTVKGILYYNDSKATNIESVIYAVQVLKKPIILLAGGKNKGLSFTKWQNTLCPYIKKCITFGETAGKIQNDVYSNFSVEVVENLKEAFDLAQKEAKSGDVVLLSPGCSSYDQFNNFEERGEAFIKLVLQLQKDAAHV